MNNIIDFVLKHWLIIVDCILAIAAYIGIYFFFKRFKIRFNQYLVGGIFYFGLFIGMILKLNTLIIISSLSLILLLMSFALIYRNDLRKMLFQSMVKRAQTKTVVKINEDEKEIMIKNLTAALLAMSTDKMGAIITFEKEQSLDEYLKKAVPIKSVLTTELLLTIFYPGTALHDGAVVVRGNKIEAASVYFTLSTKVLTGKYGARHRAALGISEASDAITFVVSEETGRISFSQDGELEPINRDNLHKIIKDLLDF